MPIKQRFRKAGEVKRSFWNITPKTNTQLKNKGIYGLKIEKKSV